LDGAEVAVSVFSIPLKANVSLADDEREAAPAHAPAGATGKRSLPVAAGGRSNGNGAAQLEFIAGPENGLAAVAFQTLLEEEQTRYNPLVIYGPSGTGKTHLARGLVAHFATSRRANYIASADFANELTDAINANATPQFRARYRDVELLVLDDLTQLATRKIAQQELIRTLDAVIEGGGQIVVTSRSPTEKIPGLPAALRSRLSAGLALPLLPPGAEVRLELLNRFAALRRVELPKPAAKALADGLSVSAPELLGALIELQIEAKVTGQPIDLSAVRRFLAGRQLRLRPSVRTIAASSAKYFGLKMRELTSPSRRRAVVQARSIAVFLARQLTAKSLEQLGVFFGGRDHTTVLHSVRSIEARLRNDPTTRRAVSDIRKMVAQ
jgi:chromosomal replication initiator protein